MRIKPINNPKNYKIINTDTDISKFSNNFISSCFNYYYGKVKLINKHKNQLYKLGFSSSFINSKNAKQIYIIDFPNVIFQLFYEYKNSDIVIEKFYKFIYTSLSNGSNIYIISKPIILDNHTYTIIDIFNKGYELTNLKIKNSFFENEKLCVYNFTYNKEIPSSSDDLICLFISFVLFVYLLNSNIDPSKKVGHHSKKLNIITNDSQLFDKNLFGKTFLEKIKDIDYFKDLECSELKVNQNGIYYNYDNKIDSLLFKYFLSEHYRANIKDTKHLECNLSSLIEMLLMQKDSSIKPRGYFEHKKNMYNPNFSKKNFTKKKAPDFSYANLAMLERKHIHKVKNKTCRLKKTMKNNSLIHYYYLYAFIKYMQTYMYTKTHHNKEYGNFYGNYTHDEIVNLINL